MQGINDLVTPFLAVFLSEHFSGSIDGWDLSTVPPERMLEVRRRLDRRAFAPPRSGTLSHPGLPASSAPSACLTRAAVSPCVCMTPAASSNRLL